MKHIIDLKIDHGATEASVYFEDLRTIVVDFKNEKGELLNGYIVDLKD